MPTDNCALCLMRGSGIDPDEVRRVQAIVDHRSLIAADEEYLAEQQMMMRPGPFHIMSDQDSSDSDAEYWVGGGGSGAAGAPVAVYHRRQRGKQ